MSGENRKKRPAQARRVTTLVAKKVLRLPRKEPISKRIKGAEVANILPGGTLSLRALGFRSYSYEGFLAVDNLISHQRVLRAYGPKGCALLGRRGKYRLYAWAGPRVPRFARLHSVIAGVQYEKEFFMVGNRSIGDRFGLKINIFGGFSVRSGRDFSYVQSLPLFEKMKALPGMWAHRGARGGGSGMRWEGDVFVMLEAHYFLKELHEHLDGIGIEHDVAFWTPETGFVEAYTPDLCPEYLGPSCDVEATVPGHKSVSHTQGEGFFSAGDAEDDPLWKFQEVVGD